MFTSPYFYAITVAALLLLGFLAAVILLPSELHKHAGGKFNKYKYAEAIKYILTVFATLIGVSLAVYFSELDSRKEKKEKAIRNLSITRNNLVENIHYLRIYKSGAVNYITDTIHRYHLKWKESTRFKPVYFILENPEVIVYVSDDIINSLTKNKSFFDVLFDYLDKQPLKTNSEVLGIVNTLDFTDAEGVKKISWEIQYQKDSIKYETLANNFKQFDSLALFGHYDEALHLP